MKKIIKFVVLFSILFVLNNKTVNAEETHPTIEVEKVSTYTMTDDEKLLLQRIAIAEAGDEGIGGMAFVMQVVMNRVESPYFPNTVKEVIEQKGQFSTYTNGMFEKAQITENSEKAIELMDVLENRGALYFNMISQNNT